MKARLLIFTIIIMLTTMSIIHSATTTGADFLKIPKSARAIGLGDSYTAIIGDSTAIEYNPAALNTVQSFAVSMMYQGWIDNTYGLYLSTAIRRYDFVFAGSLYFVNYGGLDAFDPYGALQNQYFPHDLNIKFALSFDSGLIFPKLTGLSFGASVSILERSMVDEGTVGFTFDIGVNYETSFGRLQMAKGGYFANVPIYLGFSMQNLGYAVSSITPVKTTIGLAVGLFTNFIVSLDTAVEYGRPFLYKMGFEYAIKNIIILRTGFNLGKDTGNLSFGVGLRYPRYFRDLRFDYAFSYMGVLGNNHNFSVYMDFPSLSDRVERYYRKGIYHYIRGEYELAREYWDKALVIDPENKLIKKKLDNLNKLLELNRKIEGY